MHITEGFGQMLQRFSMHLLDIALSKLISKHGKRVLFITSLYAQLVRRDQLRLDAVYKLNVLMNISSSADALRFPTTFTGMIWSKRPLPPELVADALNPNLPEETIWSIASDIVRSAPTWMPYARRDVMEHDVYNLIQSCRNIGTAPALAYS